MPFYSFNLSQLVLKLLQWTDMSYLIANAFLFLLFFLFFLYFLLVHIVLVIIFFLIIVVVVFLVIIIFWLALIITEEVFFLKAQLCSEDFAKRLHDLKLRPQ